MQYKYRRENCMPVSENIKAIRNAAGLTQEDFGEIFGVGKAVVSLWENGKREPAMGIIEKIANRFYVSIDDLVKGDVTRGINRAISEADKAQALFSRLSPKMQKKALQILEMLQDEE
jgi:transcriptional regulator with XRE-family HTH domain